MQMMERFEEGLVEKTRTVHGAEEGVRFHFTSDRKRMSTVITVPEMNEHGHDKRLHCKGASEYVFASCSHYLNENGQKTEIDDSVKNRINDIICEYANQALRTICFAYKELKKDEGGPMHNEQQEGNPLYDVETTDMTMIAIAGIRDVIRLEVPGAVAQCKTAGVTVRMVTGDNKLTALAISKECGIIDKDKQLDDDAVMEGPEFYNRCGGLICKNCKTKPPCDCEPSAKDEGVKNIDDFKALRPKLMVLARSRPEDKYLLVTGLRELGDIVAVTGDGTNDAPALKKADVGFAMGITGTDVAQFAADIIIMDDNFNSIVKACMWGRNIYENIRRFLQFQLTVNVVALLSAFVGACILKESPLQPIQLLWVNLIMDSLASLALATEAPSDDLLLRQPYKRDEYIVSRKMFKHLLCMSVYQSIVVFVFVFAGEFLIPESDPEQVRDGTAFVRAGRLTDFDGSPMYDKFYADVGPSRQFTFVFALFVFL